MCFKKLNKEDPVKHCVIYKRYGCAHVDGFLCDFNTCEERKLQELADLEQELDVPYNLRYHNKDK